MAVVSSGFSANMGMGGVGGRGGSVQREALSFQSSGGNPSSVGNVLVGKPVTLKSGSDSNVRFTVDASTGVVEINVYYK